MKSFVTDKFTYISYTEMDEELSRMVWHTRNLPEIRKNMVNNGIIPIEEHNNFITNLKKLNDVAYFCVIKDNQFIGTINIHFENQESAERGIFLHPSFQGKGLSKKICKDFYKYLKNNYCVHSIITKVKIDNINSNALENSLGAVRYSHDEQFIFYRCYLDQF